MFSRVKVRSWESPVQMLFGYETLGKKMMPQCADKNNEEMNVACYGFWYSVRLTRKAALLKTWVTKILL